MMRGMQGLFAAALMISLAACSGQPASPSTDDAEREQLVQRALDLKDRVAAAGRATPEHQREVRALAAAFRAWQERTGRDDISATTPKRDGSPAMAQAIGRTGPTDPCGPCPPVSTSGSKICFLVEDVPCAPGSIFGRLCVYACFYLSR